MSRLFGTDGIRGVANQELTADLAYRLAYAAAHVLVAREKGRACRFLLGSDTRLSKDMLRAALSAGLCAAGADVWDVGVLPTPAIAYLTKEAGCEAGIVISASHNPYEFNGLKLIAGTGYKLPDAVEDEIEAAMQNIAALPQCAPDELGTYSFRPELRERYIEHLLKAFPLKLDGLKIALDCANGAAFQVAPEVFRRLGAEVTAIGVEPNGLNINKGCGSTDLSALQALMHKGDFALGLAFDGDADRLLALDHEGQFVDGDRILAILAKSMRARGRLKGDTLVVTVMSNLGLDIFASAESLNLAKTKVGDRYVLEKMLAEGFCLGGEQSGHIILLDYATTGDGILSALALLDALQSNRQPLHEAAAVMTVLPQVLRNVRVANGDKERALADAEFEAACQDCATRLANRGRVLIRPSGTEPLIRIMLEGEDQAMIETMAESLAAILEQKYSPDRQA